MSTCQRVVLVAQGNSREQVVGDVSDVLKRNVPRVVFGGQRSKVRVRVWRFEVGGGGRCVDSGTGTGNEPLMLVLVVELLLEVVLSSSTVLSAVDTCMCVCVCMCVYVCVCVCVCMCVYVCVCV